MLDLNGNLIHADDVIDAAYRDTYSDHYRTVYGHLALVKNTLFIVEQISSFPFDFFTHETDRTFWVLTSKALFDETILALWLLVSENEAKKNKKDDEEKKGRFAVDNFAKRVVQIYLKKDLGIGLRNHIQNGIDDVHFDERIDLLKRKISAIRNHHIAHLDFDTQMGFANNDPVQYRMTVPEMYEALNIAHELFVACSFDGYPNLDYWEYASRPHAKNYFTDVEFLLGFVASRHLQLREYDEEQMKKLQVFKAQQLTEPERKLIVEWNERLKQMGIKK